MPGQATLTLTMCSQTALRILPLEAQQGVLKDFTALYQKTGITFNQFLTTLQQRQAAQRQVRCCRRLLMNCFEHTESARSTCRLACLLARAQGMLAALFAVAARL